MTAATQTLADFLLACVAEDEAKARAATDGGYGWRLADLPGANEVWANRDAAGHDAFMVATTATRLNRHPGVQGYADATHIATWDPARVLAECEAKRRIVTHCVGMVAESDEWDEPKQRTDADFTLRCLALPYADREGFREEWKP